MKTVGDTSFIDIIEPKYPIRLGKGFSINKNVETNELIVKQFLTLGEEVADIVKELKEQNLQLSIVITIKDRKDEDNN